MTTKRALKAARKAGARKIRGERVRAADLARQYGVTDRTIVNWVNQANPRPCPSWMEGRARYFDTADVADWRAEVKVFEAMRAAESESPAEFEEARARKMAADASRSELALARERGELVLVEEYQRRVTEFVGGFAAVAAGRLQRYERDIVRARTAPEARRVTDQIHAALMQGAQDYADQMEAEMAASEAEGEEE